MLVLIGCVDGNRQWKAVDHSKSEVLTITGPVHV